MKKKLKKGKGKCVIIPIKDDEDDCVVVVAAVIKCVIMILFFLNKQGL